MNSKSKHPLARCPLRQLLNKQYIRALRIGIPTQHGILLPSIKEQVVKPYPAFHMRNAGDGYNTGCEGRGARGEDEREDTLDQKEMREVVPCELDFLAVFADCVAFGADRCIGNQNLSG